MPPYKRTYARTANSGAKEGLALKMKYWATRDFKTEFSITLGQAMNLAATTLNRTTTIPAADFEDLVWDFFQMSLKLRTDPKFRDAFEDYYEAVKKLETATEEGSPEMKAKTLLDKITDNAEGEMGLEAAVDMQEASEQ